MKKLFVITSLVVTGFGTAYAAGTAVETLRSGVSSLAIEAAAAPLPAAPSPYTPRAGKNFSSAPGATRVASGPDLGKLVAVDAAPGTMKVIVDPNNDGLAVTDGFIPELTRDGFKVRLNIGSLPGAYVLLVDISGADEATTALALTKYDYIDFIYVSRSVYNALALEKIKVGENLSPGTIIMKLSTIDCLAMTDAIEPHLASLGYKFTYEFAGGENGVRMNWKVTVDVSGAYADKAKAALALAMDNYLNASEVLVSKKVYDILFPATRQ